MSGLHSRQRLSNCFVSSVLQVEVHRLVWFVGILSFTVAMILFVIGLIRKTDPLNAFVNGFILVVVANVPEVSPCSAGLQVAPPTGATAGRYRRCCRRRCLHITAVAAAAAAPLCCAGPAGNSDLAAVPYGAAAA